MICALVLIYLCMQNENRIIRYIYSISTWMLYCFFITELFSIGGGINTTNLWLAWLILDVVLLVVNVIKFVHGKKELYIKKKFYRVINKKILIWSVFAIGMLAIAIKTVPYNYDSMTYHLPRLFHWLQNGSVDHYASSIDRQIGSAIGGAYVNLHVYAMCGGNDRLLNILQCCSYLTNGLLVYYIAKEIGCSKKYCNMALLLFYTMPIAVAEAFTTQVDNFAALWVLATIYLLLDLLSTDKKMLFNKETLFRVLGLSLCVGFGYLTKPSVGVGFLVFAIWLLIAVIKRRDNPVTVMVYLLIAGGVLSVLLLPGFYRNIITFGALSAPNVGKRQLIGTLNPRQVLVNFIKVFTFNMPTVWIYDSGTIIYKIVMWVATLLRVDINNPAISEDGREYIVYDALKYSHDRAVNPIIVYLLIVCIVVWVVRNRKRFKWEIGNCYFVTATIAFLIFCAILRWEPFVSRYMISYMAVLCPALVCQLQLAFSDEYDAKWKRIGVIFCTLIYFVCMTETTGLINYHTEIAWGSSRYSGYFFNNKYVEENYRDIAEYIDEREYKNIGLQLGRNTYEYPLTVMLKDCERIEHVNVINQTNIYEDETFIPEIIISIEYGMTEEKIVCYGKEYEVVEKVADDIYLLEPVNGFYK